MSLLCVMLGWGILIIMSSEQLLPQRITQVINGNLPIESVLEDIESLGQPNYQPILRNVFNEIIKGCNSKSSVVVDMATKIVHELIHNPSELVLEELNSEEFQKALMYTLRGKTTRFGNKFSMHKETWRIIEDRVLGFYASWFDWYMMKEDKVKNILANYVTLKTNGIKFPEPEPCPVALEAPKEAGLKKELKIQIDNRLSLQAERDGLETFLEQYSKMIDCGIDSSIVDSIEFKIKEKLIYALNSVLLQEEAKNRLKLAVEYNRRFNELIQKLNSKKTEPKKQNKIKQKQVQAKSLMSIPQTEEQQQVKPKKEAPKISRMRSLIRSTLAFMSSQPKEIKDEETKDVVRTKLDETIGDLVKYFDNQEEADVDVEKMHPMTKSSLY